MVWKPSVRGFAQSAALAIASAAAPGCDRENAAPPHEVRAGTGAKPAAGFSEFGRQAGLRFKMEFLRGEQGENFKVNLYDHGAGLAVADVDGDGNDDVLFLNQIGRNGLFRGDGHGRFTDATAESGVAMGDRVCVAAAFGDVDGDGDQDLYVTSTRGGNVLFRNDGAGHFADVTADAGLTLVAHSESAAFFDYDGDGRLDLMITDMHSDMWMGITMEPPGIEEHRKYAGVEGPMVARHLMAPEKAQEIVDRLHIRADQVVFGNTLFRNRGDGRFEEVSDKAGVETFWPWGVAAADFDLDGHVDMFLPSGMGRPMFYWRSYLLMNRGDGTFEDRARSCGIDPPPGGEYLDDMVGRELATRSPRAAAVLDFDGDGRPDLVVANFNERPYLYRNEFPSRHWAALRLTGTRSNRDAIGAVATLRAGGRSQVRQVEAASGYLAQSTKTLYFGLADAAAVESCEIRWPSGLVQKLDAVKLDALTSVTEPGAK